MAAIDTILVHFSLKKKLQLWWYTPCTSLCMSILLGFDVRLVDSVLRSECLAECIYLDLKNKFDQVPCKKWLWYLGLKNTWDVKVERKILGRMTVENSYQWHSCHMEGTVEQWAPKVTVGSRHVLDLYQWHEGRNT